MSLAAPAQLKLKGRAGHWLVQQTAPLKAKPDGRPYLEGGATNTQQAAHFLHIAPPPYTSRIHTLAHTYQFPSATWITIMSQC